MKWVKNNLNIPAFPQLFCDIAFCDLSMIHPFSTYAKFTEKLTFLTPYYAHARVRIR